MTNLTDKTLALAGVFQCARLVSQIANKGIVDQYDLETIVRSTLNQNPDSTLAVYGNYVNINTGLHALIQHLSDGMAQRDMNTARYVISLLHLARKVWKRNNMLTAIATRLERVQEQVDLFGITHDNVLANLASIYSDTISTLSPKIMVTGDTHHLSNPQNADKIRAILMGGIRSAILWQQNNGSRWQILLKRRRYVDEARRILEYEMSNQLH